MTQQFNEDGTYNKTDWKAGDKITATKLNKIEDAIEAVNDHDISRHEEADARLDALEAGVVANKQEIEAKVDALEDTVVSNKDAADLDIYRIDQHMTLLDKKIDDGVAEVYGVAETVDTKIAEADASMKAQVAEVEADLDGLHAKDEELSEQLEQIPNLVIEAYSDNSMNSSLINAVNDCISKNKKLNLHKKEYILNNRITFTNLCDVEGNGATLVVNDMIDPGEFAILLDGLKDVTIRDLNFEIKDTSPYRTLLGLYNSNNVKFINCKFIANFETVEATHNTLDLYKGNVDIVFDNCTFLQLNNGDEGGIWVRNTQDIISKNINFNNCKFYKRGYDEILAIWGWQGEISNVNVNNSDFYIYAGDKIPDWAITLGQSGITQCKLSNCNIYCEEHTSLFRCIGESHAVVENCKITSLKSSTPHQALVQSDTDAYFEIRGCDISLSCTAGSIARHANNIENNVFNITSSTGFMSCGNIKGNKINATTSSYLLISNENVDSNIFNITSILGRFEENTNNLKNNKCSITADNVNGTAIFKHDKNSIIKNNQLTLTVTTGNIKLINLSNDSGRYIFAQNDIIINSGYYASNNTKLGTFVSYNNIVNYTLDNI